MSELSLRLETSLEGWQSAGLAFDPADGVFVDDWFTHQDGSLTIYLDNKTQIDIETHELEEHKEKEAEFSTESGFINYLSDYYDDRAE